jgi:Flp pilus assembly protein TadG
MPDAFMRTQCLCQCRRATAAVEFAVTLPLIVLLLLGAVEFGRAVMVQHTLQEAAQAGCRVYSAEDTETRDADTMIEVAMEKANITDFTVVFDPPTKAAINSKLQPVTVSVVVNYDDVAWLGGSYFSGTQITASCTMPADYTGDP